LSKLCRKVEEDIAVMVVNDRHYDPFSTLDEISALEGSYGELS
jgi:hypothetical protein